MRKNPLVIKIIATFLVGLLFSESNLIPLAEASFWSARHSALATQSTVLPSASPLSDLDDIKPLLSSAFPSSSKLKSIPAALRGGVLDNVASTSAFLNLRKVLSSNASGRVVIHLQDVHQNEEAQTNLRASVDILKEKIPLVGLEGDSKDFPMASFQRFSNEGKNEFHLIKTVADHLLQTGLITGPLAAGLTAEPGSVRFFGVEQAPLYIDNVHAVKAGLASQSETRREINRIEALFSDDRRHTFNSALTAFDQSVERFQNGQVLLGEHVQLLASLSKNMVPEFETFIEALHAEGQLNESAVEGERTHLLESLLPRLHHNERTYLTALAVAYKSGQLSHADFYTELSRLCSQHKLVLTAFPNLHDYIQYVFLTDSVDPERLMEKIGDVESATYASLSKTHAEKLLVRKLSELRASKKLVGFKMSADEWSSFKTTPTTLPLTLDAFRRFYELAEKRDSAMAGTLLAQMDGSQASTALLVTGGFHTDGVLKALSRKGVTVVSLSPKLTQIPNGDEVEPLNLFTQEKTPLDRLFEGEPLFLSPKPDLGLPRAPFLAAATAAVHIEHGMDPLRVLRALAPSLRFTKAAFSGKNRTGLGTVQTESGTVTVKIKTGHDSTIESSSLNVLSNTHLWSAGGTLALAFLRPDLTNGFVPLAATWLIFKSVLWVSVLLDESGHLLAEGAWSPTTLKATLHQENLWKAFFLGREFERVYVDNTLSRKVAVRFSGFLGVFSHVSLAVLGYFIAGLSPPAFNTVGVALLSVNTLLLLLARQDAAALIWGRTALFACGIGGYIERRTRAEQRTMNPEMDPTVDLRPKTKAKQAKRDKNSLNRMGFNTKRRGFQSAGMMETVIMPETNNRYVWMVRHPIYAGLYLFLNWLGWIQFPSVNDLAIEGPYGPEARVIHDPENRAVQMALKLVNTKRGEIINRLLVATGWLHKIAIYKGYEPHPSIIDPSFHTRFATGGPTERKEAHPHQFMKPRIVKAWTFIGGRLQTVYKVLSTWIDHNGDFNGLKSPMIKGPNGEYVPLWPLFEKPKNKVEVSKWLQKVLGTVDKSKGDSPKISGMMDLLITQGMWFASARLAYQMAVVKSNDEAAPSSEALNELAEELEHTFVRHASPLYPNEADQLGQINKGAIPAFIEEVTTRLGKNISFSMKWTPEERKNFAEIALQSFLYNDPQQAMRLLFALAAKGSTFGLLVDSTINSKKKYVTASTQPMSIGHDPEQERVVFGSDFNATKSGLINFDLPGTRVMNLEQGGENGREIAVLDHTGEFEIYSLKRHTDLRRDEINVRWAPTKDNSRLTQAPEPVHERMLDRDLALIVDEVNGVHDRWTDPNKKDADNLVSAEHYFKQILKAVKEVEALLKAQEARGESPQVLRPRTPDLLFIGLENSFVAAREFAVQLEALFPNLNIKFMTANQFNVAWNEDEIRKTSLFGANTTVMLVSRHGGTFPTQNAAEVINELDKKAKAQRMTPQAEPVATEPKPEGDPKKSRKKTKDDLEDELLAKIAAGLAKNQAGREVREIFTVTEQPDSEMARTVGQSLKPSDKASNRVFAVKGQLSMSEPAPLAVAKTHQFFTELLIYIGERMLQEKKLHQIAGFGLTAEGLARIKKADERARLTTIPGLVGRQPNNPDAELTTTQRKQMIAEAKLMGKHIREASIFTLVMAAYTILTVNFGHTLFQFWGPLALSYAVSLPALTQFGSVLTLGAIVMFGLTHDRSKRTTKFLLLLVGIPDLLVILPHGLNVIMGEPLLSQTWWVVRAAKFYDSIFYVFGGWALVLAFRYKDLRQVFGRFVGTRQIFLVDRPGVAEIAYVYFTKVFSKAFGHNGVFVKQGDPANHFLQYESHSANPGDFIITGSPDPRRESPLIQNALVPAAEMGTSQTQFNVNVLRGGVGPQTISVSQKIEGGSPDQRVTLLTNEADIQADNAVPDRALVNNFIERRFDGFERLTWLFLFINEVQKTVAKVFGFFWDGAFTQSAAGTHTTPAPLPPIELNDDVKNRNLKAVAEILKKGAAESPDAMWVPEGTGALYTALLYDPFKLPVVRRPVNRKKKFEPLVSPSTPQAPPKLTEEAPVVSSESPTPEPAPVVKNDSFFKRWILIPVLTAIVLAATYATWNKFRPSSGKPTIPTVTDTDRTVPDADPTPDIGTPSVVNPDWKLDVPKATTNAASVVEQEIAKLIGEREKLMSNRPTLRLALRRWTNEVSRIDSELASLSNSLPKKAEPVTPVIPLTNFPSLYAPSVSINVPDIKLTTPDLKSPAPTVNVPTPKPTAEPFDWKSVDWKMWSLSAALFFPGVLLLIFRKQTATFIKTMAFLPVRFGTALWSSWKNRTERKRVSIEASVPELPPVLTEAPSLKDHRLLSPGQKKIIKILGLSIVAVGTLLLTIPLVTPFLKSIVQTINFKFWGMTLGLTSLAGALIWAQWNTIVSAMRATKPVIAHAKPINWRRVVTWSASAVLLGFAAIKLIPFASGVGSSAKAFVSSTAVPEVTSFFLQTWPWIAGTVVAASAVFSYAKFRSVRKWTNWTMLAALIGASLFGIGYLTMPYVTGTAIPFAKSAAPSAWYWSVRVVGGLAAVAGVAAVVVYLVVPQFKKVSLQTWKRTGVVLLIAIGFVTLAYLIIRSSPMVASAWSGWVAPVLSPIGSLLMQHKQAIFLIVSSGLTLALLWKYFSSPIKSKAEAAKKMGPRILTGVAVLVAAAGTSTLFIMGGRKILSLVTVVERGTWNTLGWIMVGTVGLLLAYRFRRPIWGAAVSLKNIRPPHITLPSMPAIPLKKINWNRVRKGTGLVVVGLAFYFFAIPWMASFFQGLTSFAHRANPPEQKQPTMTSGERAEASASPMLVGRNTNISSVTKKQPPENAASPTPGMPTSAHLTKLIANTEQTINFRRLQLSEDDAYAKMLEGLGAYRDINNIVPKGPSTVHPLTDDDLKHLRKLSSFSSDELTHWNGRFDDASQKWVRFSGTNVDGASMPTVLEADATWVMVIEKNGVQTLVRVDPGLKTLKDRFLDVHLKKPGAFGLGDLDANMRGTNSAPRPRSNKRAPSGSLLTIHLNEAPNKIEEDWARMKKLMFTMNTRLRRGEILNIIVAVHGSNAEQQVLLEKMNEIATVHSNITTIPVGVTTGLISYRDLFVMAEQQNKGRLPLLSRILKGEMENIKLLSATRFPSHFIFDAHWFPRLKILTEIEGLWKNVSYTDLDTLIKSTRIASQQT